MGRITPDGNQMIHLVVPREMYREADRLAHRQKITLSAVIREALALHLEHELGVKTPHFLQPGGYRPRKQG